MRGKNKSPQPKNPKNGEQETTDHHHHISGAHIRSLVKQLTRKPTPSSSSSAEHQQHGDITGAHDDDLARSKKQARRRVQARKPYQERLLNMAEARREIVAALRLHRASTRRPGAPPAHEAELKSSGFSAPEPPPRPPLMGRENLDFALPSRALGLNLNLRGFHDLGASFFHFNPKNSSIAGSPSYPSTSTSSAAPGQEIQCVAGDSPTAAEIWDQNPTGWDDEFRFVGVSDWRAEFMDIGLDREFDDVEFPAWMNANESCLESVYDSHDSSLPCMDIEEIEGMDGDWLA